MKKSIIGNGVSEFVRFLAIHSTKLYLDVCKHIQVKRALSKVSIIEEYQEVFIVTFIVLNCTSNNQEIFIGLNAGYPNNRLATFPINAGDSPNYFNNLNYGICIMLANGYCGIKYEATEFDFGGTQAGQSCIGSNAGLANQCFCTISDSLEDEGDYLTIVGASSDGFTLLQNQFCGQKLNR